jgi:glycosyltransferase involved in cell wall biosynthesis
MKELPLISVILPVYRVEKYLDRCLQSITEQTYRNLEIILVDDGSPDNSGAICDAWAKKDSRIRVIHQKNSGGGPARNAGLDQASGELLAFVDSDDYIAADMFAHLYELLETGADVAECDYLETVDDGVVFPDATYEVTVFTPEEAMRNHIQDIIFRQVIWNKLYRRKLSEGVRFPAGTKIDDEYFTYRLLGNAKKLVRSNKICYAYRQQEGSIMHQSFSLKRVEALQAKQQRLEWLQQFMPSMEQEARADLIMTCIYVMQGSLKSFRGEELKQAKNMLAEAMAAASPLKWNGSFSKMRNLLLYLAQIHLGMTARLLNFLIAIHVLT